MKLEDPMETWEFFHKTAGEAYVTKVDAFQTKPDGFTNTYLDTKSSSSERRARIDLLDLKDQREGEMHVFFKSKIVRAKVFFANPKPAPRMRVNQFLKVDKPDIKTLVAFERTLTNFSESTRKFISGVPKVTETEEISIVARELALNKEIPAIERGVNALIAFHNFSVEEQMPEETEEVAEEQLNVFTKMRLGVRSTDEIMTNDWELFTSPLINKLSVRERIEYIERTSGKAPRHAANITEEVVKDMQVATYYPPVITEHPGGAEISNTVDELIAHIVETRAQAAPKTEGQ
jgi:intracellular multiplication protein IcmO